MDSRARLFGCLFCVLSCGVLVLCHEGHGSICRSNERFLSCGGCQKTCRDPSPDCKGVCRTGCYCNEDEVRNDTGHCVKLADCPPMELSSLHFSEPRHSDSECPADEEYRSCEPCNRTCDNPNPICPAQCARGCFCRDDLVRDRDGRCVKVENCSVWKKNESTNLIKPIAYQLTCGPHQVYSSCRSCEATCSSPAPVCRTFCSAGCYCEDGYVKAPSGKCVRLEDCPKAEVSLGGAHEPSIEDCSTDEVYLSCGWCEPTCSEPRPQCPRGVCTRGCLCRPPLLRHHSGHCVTEDNCKPQKCSDPNEEFVCRYGCEARCDSMKCNTRPRLCVLGCHCRLGLLRDVNGKCVTQDNCQLYSVDLINFSKVNDSESVTDEANNTFVDNSTDIAVDSTPGIASMADTQGIAGIADRQGIAGIADTQGIASMADTQGIAGMANTGGMVSIADAPGLFGSGMATDFYRAQPMKKELESVFDVNPRIDDRPQKDLISRAIRLYKELLNSPLRNREFYVPRSLKDMTNVDNSRDSQLFRSGNGPVVPVYSVGDAQVKNYMQDIISVMKEMMPPPVNFTLPKNYPWTPDFQGMNP